MWTHLPAILCAGLVVGLLLAEWRENALAKAITKTSASIAFIVYAVASGAVGAGLPGLLLIVGLVLGAVGDVCLLSRQRGPFLAGTIAFLLDHVFVGAALALLAPSWLGGLITAVPLAIAGAVVGPFFVRRAGRLAPAVVAYVLVISAMVAVAGAVAWADPSPVRLGLLAAAVTFYLSDLCVAVDRFVAAGLRNRVVGLPLYYGAQLAFAGLIASAV